MLVAFGPRMVARCLDLRRHGSVAYVVSFKPDQLNQLRLRFGDGYDPRDDGPVLVADTQHGDDPVL